MFPMTTDTTPRARAREWFGLAVLVLPTLLLSLDLSVLYLAIPHISMDLKPSSSQTLWILDVYGFMIAGFLITMGTLGDRIGRRKLLLTGATVFGITSVIAAYSVNAEMLVATRAFLGIAGATIMPSTLALISNMFKHSGQRSMAIALWMSCFLVGTAIGPVVGGLLLESFWWGSVFLLGVPVMALLLVTAPFLLPEYRDPEAGTLDLYSVPLSLATILPMIYGLKEIAKDGFQLLPSTSILVSLLVGILFLRRQNKLKHPLMDLSLFNNRRFNTALSLMLFSGFILSGMILYTTQYLQMVEGMTPMYAGFWLLPSSGAMIAASMLAPVLSQKMKAGPVLILFLAIAMAGCLLLIFVEPDSMVLLITGMVLVGIGSSPIGVICTDLVVGSAPPEKAGSASSLSETSAEFGIALGVAVLGSIGTTVYRNMIADNVPPSVPADSSIAIKDTLANALVTINQLPEDIAGDLLVSAQEAFTQGFSASAMISALLLAVLSALSWRMFRDVTPSPRD
ncbi:MFS transporter [Bacillus sp. V3-13]|uniref:MFS transporter n=1 Tax=Bacillus sp. V3-13 TaxID=2053728 RepID=UPI001C609A11|nr:MFS transporter [Bacillus sp. V3-13]